jgi:hypothetical protein
MSAFMPLQLRAVLFFGWAQVHSASFGETKEGAVISLDQITKFNARLDAIKKKEQIIDEVQNDARPAVAQTLRDRLWTLEQKTQIAGKLSWPPLPCTRCQTGTRNVTRCRVDCLLAGIATRMASLEAKIGKAAIKSCTAPLAGLTKRFELLSGNVLSDDSSLHIAVVGGSNTAGAGISKYGVKWPIILQQNLQWLFSGIKRIEVQSSANGGTTSQWAAWSRDQQVNGSSRIILWEYALNDFPFIQYAEGDKTRSVEYWIQVMTKAFPYSSFGFIFLDDGSMWKHESPVHCSSEEVEKRKLREYAGGNTSGPVEMFGVSTCDYQRFFEAQGTEQAKKAYADLWSSGNQHLHDTGSMLLAELVEYSLIVAIQQAISSPMPPRNNPVPAMSWRPQWEDVLSTPPGGVPGGGNSRRMLIQLATPNFGVFPSITVQCRAKDKPQTLSEVLGGERGCMRVPPSPREQAQVLELREAQSSLPEQEQTWLPHYCRKLSWYKNHSEGEFISRVGDEGRQRQRTGVEPLERKKVGTEWLEETQDEQRCDMSRCPSCLVLAEAMIEKRNDAKLALFLEKEHLCGEGTESLRIGDIPFGFTHLAFHTQPMEAIQVRFCAHDESEADCASKSESPGQVWNPKSGKYTAVHASAIHAGGRLIVCMLKPQLEEPWGGHPGANGRTPNVGINTIDFTGIDLKDLPSSSTAAAWG